MTFSISVTKGERSSILTGFSMDSEMLWWTVDWSTYPWSVISSRGREEEGRAYQWKNVWIRLWRIQIGYNFSLSPHRNWPHYQWCHGYFCGCKSDYYSWLLRVEEGEAMGVQEALSWVKQLGLHKVLFECDSKMIVDATLSRKNNMSEFGYIIGSCIIILESRPMFRVKHVFRDVNFLAHQLARRSREFLVPHVWDELPRLCGGPSQLSLFVILISFYFKKINK